ncbi:MAG: RNA 2',3'-cyclic phosphodiesterase [Planctomycetaceae bacterium]|nr:RNA 2',3'-cyclic phosphodiesterase [Planctomycetaceae bacterium]
MSSNPSQRCFIAIELDDAARADLADFMQQVNIEGLRPTAPENLHLTVKFLGNVVPDLIARVAEALEQAANDVAPFELHIEGIDYIPHARRPRVLAARCDVPPTLSELVDQTESMMELLGFPREGRPYRAHITLGRFRRPPRLVAAVDSFDTGLISVPVDHITLMASDLQPTGPVYSAVSRALLPEVSDEQM